MFLSNLRMSLLSGLSIVYLCSTVGSDPIHATKPRKGTSSLKETKHEKESEFEILKERWLEDFETENQETQDAVDYEEMMQADSPARFDRVTNTPTQKMDDELVKCPPPPRHLPAFSCLVPACQSDKSCSDKGLKCCYNGCQYTCMIPVEPPSYVDWVKQPQRRLVSGMSWLVPGEDEQEEVEWCSTTQVYEADEEPLLCPEGFVCHIEDPGDEQREIPNRGRCVPESHTPSEKHLSPGASSSSSSASCKINKKIFQHGKTFELNDHSCKCMNGAVMCQVGKQKPT